MTKTTDKKKATTERDSTGLTIQQRRKAEDAIRHGLHQMQNASEIHKAVSDAAGVPVSKAIFKHMLEVIRQDFQASSGFYRESLMDAVDRGLRKIILNDKSPGELFLKAVDKADRFFDLKRKPEEDAVAICEIVDQEMQRIRGLSDQELENYQELLKNPKLDEEFHNMIEAKKRGQLYAPERGEVVEGRGHTFNITEKPKNRKQNVKKRVKKPDSEEPKP
jgi:hypothetical protein